MNRLFAAIGRISACLAVWLMLTAGATQAQEGPVGEADAAATRQVIEEQISAFRAHDHGRAYSYAAPGIRQLFPTVERFIEMVQTGYGMLYDPDSYAFGRNLARNGEIYQELIVTDKAGKQWQAVYTLRQQADGSWKITGVKINPFKGASA